MSYSSYSEYTTAEVDIADQIPTHWRTTSIKFGCSIFNGATPSSGEPLFWDGDISWITPADMGKSTTPYLSRGKRTISFEGYQSCGTNLVPKGSIIVSSRAPIGSLAIAANRLCTNQGCKALVVKSGHFNKFIFYTLSVNVSALQLLGRGTTFLELSAEDLGTFKIPTPPLSEQKAIAHFLDHETAKIDRLIAKQERLIELLKEKRQTVISHAVTKGLNPDAKMKDSGVEWLGEVPEHWVVADIKHLLNPTKGAIKTGPFGSHLKGDELMGSDVKVLNQRNVISRNFDIGEAFVNQDKYAELESFRIFPGDILVTTRGTIGRTAIAPESLGLAILHPCLMRLQVNNSISNTLLALIIQESGYFMEQLKILSNATTIDVIYSENLKNVTVAIPPTIEEQKELLQSLEKKLERLDRLAENSLSAIKLIRERRSALISAAVTGKIDVRDRKPQRAIDELESEAI